MYGEINVCFPIGSTTNPLQFADNVGLISSDGTNKLCSAVVVDIDVEDAFLISCTWQLPNDRRTTICFESEDEDKKAISDTDPRIVLLVATGLILDDCSY
jgi:hypothetical protein